MKKIQKLVLPLLVIIIIAILYFSYFASSDELGDFTRFEPNSNASLPIIVKLVKEKGVQRTQDGTYVFYVVDKNNKEVFVSGLENLPPGMDDSKTMVITGHMSGKDGFHAHGIELRN
ncbi:MAG: hypothetical protein IPH62_06625 [Ignavibacteriae bacterium]|nr:hypothetical protein [Ignavibacteriota bacterium]